MKFCIPRARLNAVMGRHMFASGGVRLWDSVAHPFTAMLELAFGCHHSTLSRVFTIDGRTYKVCCDCGATFDYSLSTMTLTRRKRFLGALRTLHTRARRSFLDSNPER